MKAQFMHLFDQQVAVPVSDAATNVVETRISAHWTINDLPNGGYLMALLANAMLHRSTKKGLAIATATYISRSTPGKATILLEPIAASKQFERIQARLVQEGRERIRAFATFMDQSPACRTNRHEADPPSVAPREACFAIPQMPKFTLFDQMEVLLDPACTGWITGRLSERSLQKGWIRFRQPRAYDVLSLLLIADAFPPPVYASMGVGAWVPTIELSINVRKLPSTQWLKCIFRTRFITCGMLEEDGQVWDEAGELIAVSRQIAQYRATGLSTDV